MFIKKPANIPFSEITPEPIYLRRREFMQLGAGLVGAAAGGMLAACGRDALDASGAGRSPIVAAPQTPIADIKKTLGQLSSTGAHGHVVQVVDPAEETFPYSGRIEFIEPEGGGSITAGRAEAWRAEYEARVARHRAEIRSVTDKLGWSFAIHRTDRAATEVLLALHARMSAPPPGAEIAGRVTMSGQARRA